MTTLERYVRLANVLDDLGHYKEAEAVDKVLAAILKTAGGDTSYAEEFLGKAQANYQELLRLLPASVKTNPALSDVLKRLDNNLRLVQRELVMLSKDASLDTNNLPKHSSLELEMEKEVEAHESDEDNADDDKDDDDKTETKKKRITLSFD